MDWVDGWVNLTSASSPGQEMITIIHIIFKKNQKKKSNRDNRRERPILQREPADLVARLGFLYYYFLPRVPERRPVRYEHSRANREWNSTLQVHFQYVNDVPWPLCRSQSVERAKNQETR